MAFDLLKYEAGKAGRQHVTDYSRTAALIDNLATTFVHKTRNDKLVADREAEKAAERDIIAGTINPDRERNEMAYGATITRNRVLSEKDKLMADLQNPASEVGQMTPKEFQEFLQKGAQRFYEDNSATPHAEVKADVFSKYSLQAHKELTAQQEILFKRRQKLTQSEAATKALANPGSATGDAFDLNTAELLNSVLPKNMFRHEERRALLVGAAAAAAERGDRRLLDFSKKYWDADAIHPQLTLQAEAKFKKFEDLKLRAFYNELYAGKEQQSRIGMYSVEQWNEDIRNQGMVDEFSRGTIDSWLTGSIIARNKNQDQDDANERFVKGFDMFEYKQSVFNEASKRHWMDWVNKAGDNKMAAGEGYARTLAAHNRPDTHLKSQFNTYLGRGVLAAEDGKSPSFQAYFTLASQLNDAMSDDQFQNQLGKAAYDNFRLLESELDINGGKFEDAINTLAEITEIRRKQDMELRLTKDERKLLDDSLDDLYAGKFEFSDKNRTKLLGMFQRGSDPIFQMGMRADLVREAETMMLKGMRHDKAIEHAANLVAKNYAFFGNEWTYTAGAPAGAIFGFPEGTGRKEYDQGLSLLAESLDIPTSEMHVRRRGTLAVVTNDAGETLATIPAISIGAGWRLNRQAAEEATQAKDATEQELHNMKLNRGFMRDLDSQYGLQNGTSQILPGVTVNKFLLAGPEEQTTIRKQWYQARNKDLKALVRGVQGVIKVGIKGMLSPLIIDPNEEQ